MTRPRLLDLFCGAGGAAMGYHRAGFDVTGVDAAPQPRYPFDFVQADATTYPLDGYDAVHASPPCQGETTLRAVHPDREYVRLLIPTLARFAGLAVPWTVENVDNATAPAGIYKVRLCGSAFGLRVRRHRWFWSNRMLLVPACAHRTQGTPLGVYGGGGDDYGRAARGGGGGIKVSGPRAAAALGVDWTDYQPALAQMIPPTYTEWIGGQLLAAVDSGARGYAG